MISAACEIAGGAAERAMAISAARSIRYWATGAIFGYAVATFCAGRTLDRAGTTGPQPGRALSGSHGAAVRGPAPVNASSNPPTSTAVFMEVLLFAAKRDHGIHPLGAAGGQPAGNQRHRQQQRAGGTEAGPIQAADAEQQRGHAAVQ